MITPRFEDSAEFKAYREAEDAYDNACRVARNTARDACEAALVEKAMEMLKESPWRFDECDNMWCSLVSLMSDKDDCPEGACCLICPRQAEESEWLRAALELFGDCSFSKDGLLFKISLEQEDADKFYFKLSARSPSALLAVFRRYSLKYLRPFDESLRICDDSAGRLLWGAALAEEYKRDIESIGVLNDISRLPWKRDLPRTTE